ncbi:unnamed protein product [Acanthoscelides obtectus]|uniref:DUF659 domain-containing protein n=1 Tax=Acanthoscelides obtectus TaxID=200917 RepID=A0A9P0MBX0_ACAOB|nr:unnamed protein product [Acanthoscelides obtectus]CAK1624219.1 hypothetical protein AOBTE_LOCUS2414 [Acanthoscelides obtectus]
MLHSCDNKRVSLDAWDISGDIENGEKVTEIVCRAIEFVTETYKTNVYAIVSDNASVMVKMGNELDQTIWHSTCSSHTANLFAKSVLD